MAKFFKLLLLLIVVGGIATSASYLGARATAGKVVGRNPSPLSERSITFQGWRPPGFEGVPDLPNSPRAWVFRYARTELPGVRRATIYVSPTGKLIATRPANLAERLETWRRAQEPGP
jgi:hypothetical protein